MIAAGTRPAITLTWDQGLIATYSSDGSVALYINQPDKLASRIVHHVHQTEAGGVSCLAFSPLGAT